MVASCRSRCVKMYMANCAARAAILSDFGGTSVHTFTGGPENLPDGSQSFEARMDWRSGLSLIWLMALQVALECCSYASQCWYNSGE